MMNSHTVPCVLLSTPQIFELGEQINSKLNLMGLDISHHRIECTTFANGELLPKIPVTIRRKCVFFLHALQYPDPNTAIVLMFLSMYAMTGASAAEISLVAPYIPYLRQDRKNEPRVPISAAMLARLIEANPSFERVITIDMHSGQEQGFFQKSVDNLTAIRLFKPYLQDLFGEDIKDAIVVAADRGATERTTGLAKALGGIYWGVFEKRRPAANQAEAVYYVGPNLKDKRIIIFEDIIDTGGTLIGVAKHLRDMGVIDINICATHGIFSNNAEERFAAADVKVACTDSIPRLPEYYVKNPWLTKVSIASYFAETIFAAAHVGQSISGLEVKEEKNAS